jgi:hypothetical protein
MLICCPAAVPSLLQEPSLDCVGSPATTSTYTITFVVLLLRPQKVTKVLVTCCSSRMKSCRN